MHETRVNLRAVTVKNSLGTQELMKRKILGTGKRSHSRQEGLKNNCSVCGGGVSGWGADPWQPEITLASCKQDKTAGQSSELDYSFPFASFLLWRLNPGVL